MPKKNLNSRTPRASPRARKFTLLGPARINSKTEREIKHHSGDKFHKSNTHDRLPRSDKPFNTLSIPKEWQHIKSKRQPLLPYLYWENTTTKNSRKTTLHQAADVQLGSKSTNLAHRSSTLPTSAQTPKSKSNEVNRCGSINITTRFPLIQGSTIFKKFCNPMLNSRCSNPPKQDSTVTLEIKHTAQQ